MSSSATLESKSKVSLDTQSKDDTLTWDEATMTWDETDATWDAPGRPSTMESKSKVSLNLEAKS